MQEFDEAQKPTAFTSGFGQYYSTKNGRYKAYFGITPAHICHLLNYPQEVGKSKAQWVIFSDYPSRSAELQRQHGRFYALWFDIDDSNISLDVVQLFLAKLGVLALAYSTKSSTSSKRKWRGIIPLAEPVNGVDFEIYQEILNDKLEAFGLVPDRVTERANQICYLPNRGEYYEPHITETTTRLDAPTVFAAEFAAKSVKKDTHKAAVIERKAHSLARATKLLGSGLSPIAAFKAAYDLENLMLSYGYIPKDGKFLSPNSLSGVPQCYITDGGRKWLSHHGSDVDAGIGRTAGKCCSGDAFDLFKFYECGNDYKAAVAKAGGMFKTADGKTITEANRERHHQSLANDSKVDLDGFLDSLAFGGKEVA